MPLSTWATAALVFVAVALGAISLALLVEWLGERRKQKDVLGQLRRFEKGLIPATWVRWVEDQTLSLRRRFDQGELVS